MRINYTVQGYRDLRKLLNNEFISLWWRFNRAINRFNEGPTLEIRHNYILQKQSSKKQLLGFAIIALSLYSY